MENSPPNHHPPPAKTHETHLSRSHMLLFPVPCPEVQWTEPEGWSHGQPAVYLPLDNTCDYTLYTGSNSVPEAEQDVVLAAGYAVRNKILVHQKF